MSTVKISELPVIPVINEDTTQTLIAGVDLVTGITGKMTTKVLARNLYSHDVLNVGNNHIIFPNVLAQFAGSSDTYTQINIQNMNGNGSTDLVLTSNNGTDTTYYIDLGIQGSNQNTGTLYSHDGYLLMQGDNSTLTGNLIIGTTSSIDGLQLRLISGGYDENNVYAVLQRTQSHFKNNVIVDGTITGPTITTMTNYTTAGFNRSNSSFAVANSAGSYGNSAFVTANSAGSYANSAFSTSNTLATTVTTQGQTLLMIQNYANNVIFPVANTALQNTSSITVNNNLTVPGTLTVTGPLYAANTIRTTSIFPNSQTAITIGFSNSSMVKANIAADLVVTLNSFVPGKFVDVIITNTSGQQHSITHGCSTINSTVGSTSFNLAASRTSYLKYFSFGGDLANTYVSITYQ